MAEELDLCMSQGTEMSSVMNNLQMGSVCVVYDGCVYAVPLRLEREDRNEKLSFIPLATQNIFPFFLLCVSQKSNKRD